MERWQTGERGREAHLRKEKIKRLKESLRGGGGILFIGGFRDSIHHGFRVFPPSILLIDRILVVLVIHVTPLVIVDQEF